MFQKYLALFIFVILSFGIVIIIQFLSFLFSSQITNVEKFSTYECGFEPYEDARNVINIHFYLIAILFIIFDLEIAFLFPWAYMPYNITGILINFFYISDFIVELLIGYLYAWKIGALDF